MENKNRRGSDKKNTYNFACYSYVVAIDGFVRDPFTTNLTTIR